MLVKIPFTTDDYVIVEVAENNLTLRSWGSYRTTIDIDPTKIVVNTKNRHLSRTTPYRCSPLTAKEIAKLKVQNII